MKLGLPDLVLEFTQKASSVIERSSRGVVCLLLNDTTGTQAVTPYSDLLEVAEEDWTAENYKYLRLAFLGKPSQVLAVRGEAASGAVDVQKSLPLFGCLNFDYFAFPECTAADAEALGSFFDTQKRTKYKKWKAVLPKAAADSAAVINLATDGITILMDGQAEAVTTAAYTARIAGLLAGLPLTQSSTYCVLDEVVDVIQAEDPDAAVDAGELVIIFDGEKFKIGRGVTSLVTPSDSMPEDFKKIKLVESADIVRTDILTTFEDTYVGKRINNYDNKQMFIGAVMTYFKSLEDVLVDKDAGYSVALDTEANRKYAEEHGTDTTGMTELDINRLNTGSLLAIAANVKFLDAMEDLHMQVAL